HGSRLAEGEFPGSDQEGEHKPDQEVVEEFERITDNGRNEDLDLVAGQTRPSIEHLEHGVFPPGAGSFRAGVAPTHGQWNRGYPLTPASGSPCPRGGTCAKRRS